ncbi:hypothetical protein [Planococcus salinus]|uniref:Uncharacterized protein n=1 Tax=Planococcus salinus TaxID=1848460 RepID=A0A3M8PA55_9BACL|nr:hypothetical protein [Planococcus salinus]RNF40533.1 hypothetical protein EEX84_03670 [Planococcus salinus]
MKLKQIVFLILSLILTLSIFPSTSLATGNGKTWGTYLSSSGTGGSVTRYNSISGTVASQCNGVYNTMHSYTYGSFNLSNFYLRSDNLRITSISKGAVTGGIGMSYNTENSNTIVYKSPYYADRLYAGDSYPNTWNRSIPLGSVNRAAAAISSTISGLQNSAVCDTEVHQLFFVGGNSRSMSSDSLPVNVDEAEVPEEIQTSSDAISFLMSEDFRKSDSSIKVVGAITDQFVHKKTGELVSIIQQDVPVIIADVQDSEWRQEKHGNLNYEVATYSNAGGTPITTLKYKSGDIYVGLVSSLNEKELIKVMRKYSKGKLFE